MKEATLCYVIRGNPASEVLLGYKKEGFGLGKYVGFGGKVEAGGPARRKRQFGGFGRGKWSVQVQVDELYSLGQVAFLFPHRPVAIISSQSLFSPNMARCPSRKRREMRHVRMFPMGQSPIT